jgi:hypothetical protein
MYAGGGPLARGRFGSGRGSSSSLSVPVRSIGSEPDVPSDGGIMPDREVIVEEKAILRLFGSDETALCSLLFLFLVYFSSQNYSPNSFIPSVFGTRCGLYLPAPISHPFAMQSAPLFSDD